MKIDAFPLMNLNSLYLFVKSKPNEPHPYNPILIQTFVLDE